MKRSATIPSLAQKLLTLFLRKELAEEVRGDLEEQFYSKLKRTSLFRARLNYWFQVIHYLRPFAIRKSITFFNHFTMLRHSLLLSFRNFKRYKSSFFINLTGLSTGLACTLLIYLWVNDELNFNKFNANDRRLFQVMENNKVSDVITSQTSTPDLLAETMLKEIPEIEMATAVTDAEAFGKFTLTDGEKNIKASGQHADKDYFSIFSFPLTQGDRSKVLAAKNGIVISEDLAVKLFGTSLNVVGKTLEWQLLNFKDPVIVTGVFKTLPSNSTAQFDFVLPFEAWKDLSEKVGRGINWDNHGPNTFVVLREGADTKQFNRKIAGFIKSKNPSSTVTLFAVPFSNLYLYGNYENGVQAGGRIEYVKLFSIIAFFILAIACINFMNLSTARASRRVKEVGIKKAIGAGRDVLVFQYLSESILLTFLSLIIALALVLVFLPQFNIITGKSLHLVFNTNLIIAITGITLATGLIAGSYPALYLSGFNAAEVLKGKLRSSLGELVARKGLVVFQFALSVILIVAVSVVYQQIRFVQHKNLGYDKDHIITFDKEGKVAQNQDAFFNEAKKLPGVANISSIGSTLIGHNSSTFGVSWEGKNPEELVRFENINVNFGMLETLGVKIKTGRSFSSDFKSDDRAIILNEAAIYAMGMKDPIGKGFNLWGQDLTIIGVAENFNFESLREKVKPLFFVVNQDKTLKVMARLEAGKERNAVDELRALYAKFNPGYTFDYKFLDQDYQRQYIAESRVGILSGYFAGLAILISCLGLFGLASFTAERRIKEIGIRKVLGASVSGIVYLLSGEFTKIVLMALLIALPVSYFLVRTWLDGFAFQIELNGWYFAISGMIALIVAWLTVGWQTLRAARVNPTECLKEQ